MLPHDTDNGYNAIAPRVEILEPQVAYPDDAIEPNDCIGKDLPRLISPVTIVSTIGVAMNVDSGKDYLSFLATW